MHRQQHQPLRAGAMTILTAVVVLCLAVLAVLALTTARADLAMAERQLTLAETQAQAECTGQAWLAAVDAALQNGSALPAGTEQSEGGKLHASLPVGAQYTLEVTVDAATLAVRQWQLLQAWQPDSGDVLWQG